MKKVLDRLEDSMAFACAQKTGTMITEGYFHNGDCYWDDFQNQALFDSSVRELSEQGTTFDVADRF